MKRIVLPALAVFAAMAAVHSQTIQHETKTINVEVPVRVFRGDAFVDSLTIGDFEVYDNGRLQNLEAVYLVKKTNIERSDENKRFAPRTARHFFLFFEVGEYDPKIAEALDYFVHEVYLPGDNLSIVTPMKTYRMRSEIFERAGRNRVFKDITGLLRRDIQIGYSESRGILEEMKSLARVMASRFSDRPLENIPTTLPGTVGTTVTTDPTALAAAAESAFAGASVDEQLQNYATLLQKLQSLRVVEQKKLVETANYLKMLPGQKDVYLFYQREFIPKIDPRILNMYMSVYNDRPDLLQTLTGLFEFFRRDVSLDVDFIKRAYSDAETSVHFLYITKTPQREEGIVMEEQSEDVFAPFLEISRATGGLAASSMNIAEMMKAAVEASENYYLLFYTPADYRADGQYHEIRVKLKAGGYRLTHRAGYIAD